MTDKEKLDKLVAEIKGLRKEVKDNIAELGNSESERIGLFKDLEIYDNILSFYDSMQEDPQVKESTKIQHVKETCKENGDSLTLEPVNKDFEMALAEMIDKAQKCVVEPLVVAEQWKDELIKLAKSEEPVSSIWHNGCEIPKSETNILMFRKDEEDSNYPPIAGCFHGVNSRLDGRNWGYYNGFCYNEIEPPVKWAYIDDILNLSNVQRTVKNWKEPVSEDKFVSHEEIATMADKASKECGAAIDEEFERRVISEDLEEAKRRIASEYMEEMKRKTGHKDYAYWNGLEKGIELGANWQKEQMMANAVDAVVKIDAGGYPYVDRTIELYDYGKDIPLAKRGDKVKIIVIKEG